MSVDNSLNNPTRNSTEPIQTRNSDAETEDDGSCAQSDASNAEEEDYEREEASTHKVSQVSTGVSHLGGPPANIHMENNSDVHIGSRLHYNAPVTINQYVHMLGNNEVTQDGILHEAVRAPIHELNPTRYIIPQAALTGPHEKLHDESRHCNGAATNYNKVASFCLQRRIQLATLAVIVLLLIILTILIVHFSSSSEEGPPKHTFYPAPKEPETNPNTTLPGGHIIYRKEHWGGQEPKFEKQLTHPTPFIVISHTATPACYSFVACAAQMRNLQDSHMRGDLDLPDIGYSFVAGGDGNVYEGRGWDATNMHTGFVRRCNIGISFIDPEPNSNMTLPGGHLIYSKEDWNGVPPKYERQLQHPTPFIVISHTATPPCYSSVACAAQMRNFQDSHMGGDLDLPDIGYSFVAGGDGNVYEGRGWDTTNMHTGFVRRCNIGISFIGNFVYDTPTNGQIEAVQELIKLGVRLGKIDKNYKLVAMNETYDTLSPGVVVYDIIKKWPHFWTPSRDNIGVCPYKV